MIDFLIKSTASLFILLACYHLLLEKEKIHQFNRFYLLFSLIFSFCIPFFTIEIIREVVIEKQPNVAIPFMEASTSIAPESTNYLLLLAYALYSLVTLVLLTRFVLNAIKLHKKSKSHTTVIYKEATLVLLPEKTLPYTFLNTIFVNREDYSNRKIEDELYTHELIHVTQKHTLDVLLIELIKVILWFNPVLHFYKKAIQLNHEFLADEKVATTHKNVPFYQNLLIAKANANPTYYLASNLNYSVTKKRLIMMTKTSSQSTKMLKKIALVPLFAALTFFTCAETVAQVKTKAINKEAQQKKTNVNVDLKDAVFIFRDSNRKITAQKKYNELTEKERNNIPPPPPPAQSRKASNPKIVKIEMTSDGPKINSKDARNQVNSNRNITPPPPPPATSKIKSKDQNAVYKTAEISTKPDYPGGMQAFYKFIALNYTAPEKDGLNGKVYVTFIVEKDGSLSDIKVLRDIGYGTGEEATRVLKLSQNWIPGMINDDAVRVSYSLPINVQTAG